MKPRSAFVVTRRFSRPLRICCGFALLIGAAGSLQAQSLAGEEAIAAKPEAAAPAPTRRVGEATAALLAAQANGSIAGPGVPMLGAAGSLSWQRYLDSFKYKIPETFDNTLDTQGSR